MDTEVEFRGYDEHGKLMVQYAVRNNTDLLFHRRDMEPEKMMQVESWTCGLSTVPVAQHEYLTFEQWKNEERSVR
jgi:hypothetical protein